MKDTYFSIKLRSEGLYKEKGSKFIGICIPVTSEEEIESSLEEIKAQYHDARHHCFAWILEGKPEKWRVSDDGEPVHSAGDPILNQIRSYELKNVLVIVVRYFGGTKLGVPGLIQAYKEATRSAIDNGNVIRVKRVSRFTIRYSYEATSEIMATLHKLEANIVDQQFGKDCLLTFEVSLSRQPRAMSKLEELEKRNFLVQEA